MTDTILRFLTGVVVPLAWPAVAVLGVWTFKKEIREAMTRIVKAGPTGIEMSPQNSGSSGATLRSEVVDLEEDSGGILETEGADKLQPWLSYLEQHLERTGKPNDIVEVKRIAAANDRRAGAQFLLRAVFGTQYEALLRMLDEPQSLSDLDDLFRKHRRKAGERAYPTPEAWLSWLTQNGFSHLSEGRYMPTECGKSVVDLIASHGLSARENQG